MSRSCADEFAATEGATPQQPRGESVAASLLVGTRDDEIVPACDETSRSRRRRSSARASRVSSGVGHFHARLRSKGRALFLALRPPLSSLNSQLACKFCLILVDRYLRRGWVDRTVCDSWISFWDTFVWLLSLKFRFEIRGGGSAHVPRGSRPRFSPNGARALCGARSSDPSDPRTRSLALRTRATTDSAVVARSRARATVCMADVCLTAPAVLSPVSPNESRKRRHGSSGVQGTWFKRHRTGNSFARRLLHLRGFSVDVRQAEELARFIDQFPPEMDKVRRPSKI